MGSYFVRMKRTIPRKLFHMVTGLQDPYKIQIYTFLLDFGVQGFGNIYIYIYITEARMPRLIQMRMNSEVRGSVVNLRTSAHQYGENLTPSFGPPVLVET